MRPEDTLYDALTHARPTSATSAHLVTALDPSGPIPIAEAPIPRYSALRSIGETLNELSGARQLIRELVRRDLRVRYKQAAFGVLWAVLTPIMIVLSGLIVRYGISQMTGTGFDRRMAAGLAIKSLAWGFFVGATSLATPSVLVNGNLVTKVYFPREVLPLSAILSQSFDTGVSACAFILLSPLAGIGLSPALLWIPVLLAILICLTVAAGLLFSCANVFFRDVKYLVQLVLTFGIFFTPVFYEPIALGPTGAKIIMANPVAPILEGLRLAIMEGHNLLTPLSATVRGAEVMVWNPWYLLYSAAIAVVGLVFSALVFHHTESMYPEYV